jgi:transposase
LFESFVLACLKISTVDPVRKQLKLSCNAVDGIMTRAVKRGLARIKKPLSAQHMNVDEVAFKKGHRYITVISDCEGRALALTDDRGTESLASYLRTLTDSQLEAVKTFSMNMNAGYIRAARIHLPDAVEKIAFDRFHVAKQLGEIVDKTRQNEHPRLPVDSRRQAKGTRFLWQYSDKWMTES